MDTAFIELVDALQDVLADPDPSIRRHGQTTLRDVYSDTRSAYHSSQGVGATQTACRYRRQMLELRRIATDHCVRL